MGRALESMGGGGRGDIGGISNSGSVLLLLCMIVISLSIVSMIIFVCGEDPDQKSKNDRGTTDGGGGGGGGGCGAACGGGCGGCGG
ncbi:hypothetical protein BVC80_9059g25 [Macleaya cordata]|uniref:Uncharacterized protein n=1 Tax=Macleaya cordata TaxID=56857 RepID=A0A200RAK0_MACCD|nr:hypothetical protein BVC80_9059g25 [Macleaya cordata]